MRKTVKWDVKNRTRKRNPSRGCGGHILPVLCGLRGLRSTKAFRFSLKAWTGFVDSPLAQTAQIRPTTRKPKSQVLLKPLQSAQNQEVSACRSPWRGSSFAYGFSHHTSQCFALNLSSGENHTHSKTRRILTYSC